MASYIFETILPAEAAGFLAADSLAFSTGAANLLSVQFQPAPEQVVVSMAGRSVAFGPGLYGEAAGFPDGGMLLIGTPGADNLVGGAAGDALFAGAGADVLSGGALGDVLQGNQGADTLSGDAGSDTVYGGQDNDVINLGSAADEHNFTNGNRGNDTITAGNGGDTLLGGQGEDSIVGGAGGDLIFANLGDDTVAAGDGADTIHGNGGYDVMSSGAGADLFVFEQGSSVIDFQLSDRILDWAPEDRIDLTVPGGYTEVEATAPLPPNPYGGGGYMYAPVDDFMTAQNAAASALAGNPALSVVAAQAGSDVVVFIDSDGNHAADMAIILSNITLGSVSAGNFI